MKLNDTTTLEKLFAQADEWAAMPVSTLSDQQIALINFRNAARNTISDEKNGGKNMCCFICYTGA